MELSQAIDRYFGKNSAMKVEAVQDQKGLVVVLSGSLDLECSRSLQDLLSWIIENSNGKSSLVVDLGNVNYISSTGVGALTIALTAARRLNTRFLLRNLQPKVRAIFQLLGLMDYFEEAGTDD